MTRTIPRGAVVSTFFRSFLIQGSWNYHSMLGAGFAFAMMPGLRHLFRQDPAGMEEAVERHLEHFNAHPYLSNLALGAALRLEADGADAETIRRFKVAVRGPLGGLGDALVWATWLPAVAVMALILYWAGAPPWVIVAGFLVTYNSAHIAIRVWALRVGLQSGRDVGRRLAVADFRRWTARLQPVLGILLGALSGMLLGTSGGLVDSGVVWAALAVAAFVCGSILGHRAWRPAAVATVVAVSLIAAAGVVR